MVRASTEDRFWSKVEKSDGCWEWQGSRTKGYGKFWAGSGGLVRAPRFSWKLHNGPIPDGLHVLHSCDNPPCVRPDHLFLGTNLENIRDRMAKGRRTRIATPIRFTRADVDAMRALVASGVAKKAVARQYDTSPAFIRRVVTFRVWR